MQHLYFILRSFGMLFRLSGASLLGFVLLGPSAAHHQWVGPWIFQTWSKSLTSPSTTVEVISNGSCLGCRHFYKSTVCNIWLSAAEALQETKTVQGPETLNKEHDFTLVVLEQEAKVWLEIIKAAEILEKMDVRLWAVGLDRKHARGNWRCSWLLSSRRAGESEITHSF